MRSEVVTEEVAIKVVLVVCRHIGAGGSCSSSLLRLVFLVVVVVLCASCCSY